MVAAPPAASQQSPADPSPPLPPQQGQLVFGSVSRASPHDPCREKGEIRDDAKGHKRRVLSPASSSTLRLFSLHTHTRALSVGTETPLLVCQSLFLFIHCEERERERGRERERERGRERLSLSSLSPLLRLSLGFASPLCTLSLRHTTRPPSTLQRPQTPFSDEETKSIRRALDMMLDQEFISYRPVGNSKVRPRGRTAIRRLLSAL